jgi:hypothetical protein
MDRSCDGCTKCCDGHLTANIYGYEMGPGKPCHFVSKKGCSIYEMRPYNPCKGFKCIWKQNYAVPLEFKPDLIDTIMIESSIEDIVYVTIVPAGKEISLDILDWAVSAVISEKIEHIVYQKDGKARVISKDPVFIEKYNAHLESKRSKLKSA